MHRMSSDASPVAAAARAELARAGISGRQLARELGWKPAYIARRLSGQTPMTVDDLARIAAHLGIPMATFIEPAERAS